MRNRFIESKNPTDNLKLAGKIIGRIERKAGIGVAEARKRAQRYSWFRPNMQYDGRCKRWHVFREKVLSGSS